MSALGQGKAAGIAAAVGYAALWGGAVAYLALTDGDFVTPILVMGIFGLGLSLFAWLLTRGANAPAIEVKRPALESGGVLAYLAIYAVLFLGFAMSAARNAFPEGPQQELAVMALKLTAHVLLPAVLLVAFGARLAPLFQAGLKGRKFWRTLIVLGAIILALLAIISPSLNNIAATNSPPTLLAWIAPVSFIWIAVEAGLNEEFLFRAVLQTRLAAWFQSMWASVFVSSVLFGLAHAPGLFMRGGPGVDGWSTDPWQVIAHTIAVLSPISLLFGLIYARTKSLLLVVLLHGLVDVLPNMADFIRLWT
jgi:uncharacterized protein